MTTVLPVRGRDSILRPSAIRCTPGSRAAGADHRASRGTGRSKNSWPNSLRKCGPSRTNSPSPARCLCGGYALSPGADTANPQGDTANSPVRTDRETMRIIRARQAPGRCAAGAGGAHSAHLADAHAARHPGAGAQACAPVGALRLRRWRTPCLAGRSGRQSTPGPPGRCAGSRGRSPGGPPGAAAPG